MRKNKRNTSNGNQEPTFEMKYKKYSIYKNGKKEQNYTSVGKLDKKMRLDPILKSANQNHMHTKTEEEGKIEEEWGDFTIWLVICFN